jgi:uncharacterized repeat protein (TIGR03803 family)
MVRHCYRCFRQRSTPRTELHEFGTTFHNRDALQERLPLPRLRATKASGSKTVRDENGGIVVTYTLDHPISKMRLRAAIAALILAAALVLGAVTTQSAHARTFTVLHNFAGFPDGASPFGGLIRDKSGNLYGTTLNGGADNYYGTVFKLSKGNETILYSFTGGADGADPWTGLVRDGAGNLYGTTNAGGTGGGVVFKVNTSGVETVLHTFNGGTTDGCAPYGPLILDKAGNLYGTTSGCGAFNGGTVFKVSKAGTETVLHNFAGGSSDGQMPAINTGVLMDAVGNLYGFTELGGASDNGVVYKLSKSGKLTLLHSFAGGTSDGARPYGTPVMDKLGNLYGTTYEGGQYSVGVVFKLSKTGKLTLLHTFVIGSSDGENPEAGVILDATGNLYGDTVAGGAFNAGTVFKVSKAGAETVLHSFNAADGIDPAGVLIQDALGNLYGTAPSGGSSIYGTVWKLTK